MKQVLIYLLSIVSCTQLCAQHNIDPTIETDIQANYQSGLRYKNGNGVAIDYERAFSYFERAANLGDAQSTYSVGYMKYKGLGCTQDYKGAASLFFAGAIQHRDNSMYFYGLCWRNGYGVTKNEDSARFWLGKADSLGYKQATAELRMLTAENGNDSAKALVLQINNAAMPGKAAPNKFIKIINSALATEMMAGKYSGWLVQYDWSGQSVVDAKRLVVDLKEKNGQFSGTWLEGTDTAVFSAEFIAGSFKFNETIYKRKDHYSPEKAILYDFQNASLNMVQSKDSLFLAGNVTLFSPERKEPSKPIFVALSRRLGMDNGTATIIKAGPNPFNEEIQLDFILAQKSKVQTQLLSTSGTVVYSNDAGILEGGHYKLLLQPGFIAAGTYFLTLRYDSRSIAVKVVKE